MGRFPGKTLAQQQFALAQLPLTRRVNLQRSRLAWTGALQPTPLSHTYLVRLSYGGGNKAPDVTVLEPQLHDEDVQALPHVYPGDRLCLCYPGEWHAGLLIARTIVPWASEWLLHFEIFKAIGRWSGGGHEPAVAA